PARTLERPDSLILLRDQFRLVEAAARLIGDDALPARLATEAGVQGLGPYADHLMSFPDLGAGIVRAYLDYGRLLQAATQMELQVRQGQAVWSYRVTAPLKTGRQKNELLALGYMLSIIRSFAGASWTPDRVEVPGALQGRAAAEDVFGAEIAPGPRAAVIFPAAALP
ncbi:AraC family transcriptional regulator ligand-binding domain-containing protein, partial [Hansschlegelia beijingensis]